MLTFSPTAAALIALVSGAWLAAAVWATLRAVALGRAARARLGETGRSAALLESHRAVPVVVRRGGTLKADDRLAGLLGLERAPARLDDLAGGETGLTAAEKDSL